MKKFYAFLALAAVATGAMADDFVSDGTGNVYTFNALSQIEGSGVTLQDDGSYLVAADFTISEGDVLQMDNNAVSMIVMVFFIVITPFMVLIIQDANYPCNFLSVCYHLCSGL